MPLHTDVLEIIKVTKLHLCVSKAKAYYDEWHMIHPENGDKYSCHRGEDQRLHVPYTYNTSNDFWGTEEVSKKVRKSISFIKKDLSEQLQLVVIYVFFNFKCLKVLCEKVQK